MQDTHQEGVSLVDLMIGVIVGLILIGAVLSVVVHQGHLRQSNSETSLALSACLNSIERCRTLDTAGLLAVNNAGFDCPGANGNPGGLNLVPGDLDGLTGKLTVVPDSTTGNAVIYMVEASVTWTGVNGRRTYSLQTLMGERK